MVYCGTERTKPYFFCGAIKKSWFEKLRGMDEDYPVGGYDDDDFGDRLRKEGLEFVFTDVEVHHQWHSRLSLSEAAPRAMYLEKTAAMAAGTLGTIRNLNREWGEETEPPYPPPEPPPYICPCSDCVKKRAKK